MAPHCECPMTTTSRVPNRSTANSTLPIWEGATMLPATRITNRSPRPWSNTSSAGTRASEQPSTIANGSCACVSAGRRAVLSPCRLATKRRLPARRRSRASLAGSIGGQRRTPGARLHAPAAAAALRSRARGPAGSVAAVRRCFLALPVVLAAVLAGCAAPTAAATLHALIDADNRGDLAAALACYADDAVWLPPQADSVAGLPAIRSRYETMFATYAPRLVLAVEEEFVAGDRALVRGTTDGELQPHRGGAPSAVHDRFTATLRRDAHGWRVVQLAWQP